MLLLLELLGRDFVVWDKAATIRFRRPGRGEVRARFRVTAEGAAALREQALKAGKIEPTFTVEVVAGAGEVVAEIEKRLYVRVKEEGDTGHRSRS